MISVLLQLNFHIIWIIIIQWLTNDTIVWDCYIVLYEYIIIDHSIIADPDVPANWSFWTYPYIKIIEYHGFLFPVKL